MIAVELTEKSVDTLKLNWITMPDCPGTATNGIEPRQTEWTLSEMLNSVFNDDAGWQDAEWQ